MGRFNYKCKTTMNELIKLWNEKHDDYTLQCLTWQYIVDGKDITTYDLFIIDNETENYIYKDNGDDFIKMYNELPEINKGESE